MDSTVMWIDGKFDQFVGGVARVRNATVDWTERTAIGVFNGVNEIGNSLTGAGNELRDLLNRPDMRVNLRTGLLPLPLRAKSLDNTNTEAYVWLPIAVPPGATIMVFDFTVNGDGNEDTFIFGVNDTNLFSIETKFLPDGEVSTSRLIDISAYAGTTNELFFGVLGGTSTNCAVTIEGIRFFTLASPTIAITRTSGTAVLSWPSTATDFALEATSSLGGAPWSAVTNTPTLFDSRLSMTNPWPNETRFFRLRH